MSDKFFLFRLLNFCAEMLQPWSSSGAATEILMRLKSVSACWYSYSASSLLRLCSPRTWRRWGGLWSNLAARRER